MSFCEQMPAAQAVAKALDLMAAISSLLSQLEVAPVAAAAVLAAPEAFPVDVHSPALACPELALHSRKDRALVDTPDRHPLIGSVDLDHQVQHSVLLPSHALAPALPAVAAAGSLDHRH